MKTYRITTLAREIGGRGSFTLQTFYAQFEAWPSPLEVARELRARGYEPTGRLTTERDRVNDDFIAGDTVRSTCGGARATFSPTWSLAAPWCTFRHGEAGQQFHSVAAAMRHLASKGYRFTPAAEVPA